MVDTHCHLDDARYNGMEENIINEFNKNHIDFVINNASNLASVYSTLKLTKYHKVYGAIGCHPEFVNDFDKNYENAIFDGALNEKIKAIGEIGLDYHYDGYDSNLQKAILLRQLNIANELKLPVVLHVRDAIGDAYDILKNNSNLLKYGGELHCYSGSIEMAQKFIDLGLYFGFGGTLTYKNSKKEAVVNAIPNNRLLCETDCPYLAPVPHRGEINYPHYVEYAIKKLAEIKQISFEEMDGILMQNTCKLFRINSGEII